MKIVYKCTNPECEYPDHIEYDPMDDNVICSCGSTAMGHHTNKEDLVKKQEFEKKEAYSYLRDSWANWYGLKEVDSMSLSEFDHYGVDIFYKTCDDDDHILFMWQVCEGKAIKVAIDEILCFDDDYLKPGASIVYMYDHCCGDANPNCKSGKIFTCIQIEEE